MLFELVPSKNEESPPFYFLHGILGASKEGRGISPWQQIADLRFFLQARRNLPSSYSVTASATPSPP
jgi:hypothetical protein